jgi:hypothetical protein
LVLFFSGCSTKKKITTQSTQTETKDESTTSRTSDTIANGIVIGDRSTEAISSDRTILSFDSVATVTIKPDGSIQATGTKPRIIRNRIDKVQSQEAISIDTTKVQKATENISEQKETKVIEESTDKDIKTRPAFLSFVIFIGILGLILFVVYFILKKLSIF